jgi:hypothetical protein
VGAPFRNQGLPILSSRYLFGFPFRCPVPSRLYYIYSSYCCIFLLNWLRRSRQAGRMTRDYNIDLLGCSCTLPRLGCGRKFPTAMVAKFNMSLFLHRRTRSMEPRCQRHTRLSVRSTEVWPSVIRDPRKPAQRAHQIRHDRSFRVSFPGLTVQTSEWQPACGAIMPELRSRSSDIYTLAAGQDY